MLVDVNKLPGMSDIAVGYEYDTKTKKVFSSRTLVSGSPTLLGGSRKNGVLRYTFMLAASRKTAYRVSRSITGYDLHTKAMQYEGTVGAVMAEKCTTQPVQAVERGWIIGTITNGQFSISATPKIHPNSTAASVEAERLAKEFPNKVFVKLKVDGMVRAAGIQWF